jgi:hypothetical protein
MKEDLKEIFQNVNDWLKFAEAKHAGLIVLNSGVIFGILTLFKDYKAYMPFPAILLSLLFFGVSMFFSFVSLLPKTSNKIKNEKGASNPNLYFFDSISKLTETEFKTELNKIKPDYQFTRLENDIINQIIVNSIIASSKYKFFKCALYFTIGGFTIPILILIIRLLCH